uniref:Methionyl aminopeptidase 1 n=1 Tax=Cavia porcellus TaxID=10141 RepID=A0A286XM02_CAVPO
LYRSGYHGDLNETFFVGDVDEGARKLVQTTYECLMQAIDAGGWQDETWPDGWTAVTRDGKRSAQFEHTLLVTDTGCEILTRRLDSTRPHFMSQF